MLKLIGQNIKGAADFHKFRERGKRERLLK
jgi:hypothetical protein